MKQKLLITITHLLLFSGIATGVSAQSYHSGDVAVLKAFFSQPSYYFDTKGEYNGNQLYIYDVENWDPVTNSAGITWTNDNPKRVEKIEWDSYKGLAGNLDVRNLTSLVSLNFPNNHITSLNVSGLTKLKILNCPGNDLQTLNVSGLTQLESLSCGKNQLKTLNVSGLSKLDWMSCGDNKLTSLTLSGLSKLTFLYCNNNELTSFDVSGLSGLMTYLDCSNNKLTSLNVTNLTNLQRLYCNDNLLTNLNVSGLTNLWYLECFNNQLSTLNVLGLTKLQYLHCYNNKLTTLNASGLTNLNFLRCYSNQLTSINLSGLTGLKILECNANQLSTINLSGLTGLLTLNCSYNPLQTLNLSGLTSLAALFCAENQLENLDLSNLNLSGLYCAGNQLKNLDLSNLTNLAHLYCANNQLKTLDISGFTRLFQLDCPDNYLPLSVLYDVKNKFNAIVRTNPLDERDKYINLGNQTNVLYVNEEVAVNKTLDFTSEISFNSVATVFKVLLNSVEAVSGTDYTMSNGKITFLKKGVFTVEMKNTEMENSTATTGIINVIASTNTNTPSLVLDNISVEVYPNPVQDILTIKNEGAKIKKVEVINVNGSIIYQAQPNASVYQLSTANYSKGIYFVQITTDAGVNVHKIMKR